MNITTLENKVIHTNYTTLKDIEQCLGYFVNYTNNSCLEDIPVATSIDTIFIHFNPEYNTYTMTINNSYKGNFWKDEIIHILSLVTISYIEGMEVDELRGMEDLLKKNNKNTGRFYSINTCEPIPAYLLK